MALRVLLADESTTIKKVMQLALQDFAIDVKAVHAGVDVLEVARTFQPDLIFADILLQKKNGYEVCADLKNDAKLKHIPVVLMWSSFMEFDEALATKNRADSRLEKPFDVEALRKIVLELVPKTQTQRLAHFLEYSDKITEPMRNEAKANPSGARASTPPPLNQEPPPTRQAPPPPPPLDRPETQSTITLGPLSPPPLPQKEEQAPSTWDMNSFEDVDLDKDSFASLKLGGAEETRASAKPVDDGEPWSHQDLSRFKIDLPPVSVSSDDLDLKIDLGESEFGAKTRPSITMPFSHAPPPPPERSEDTYSIMEEQGIGTSFDGLPVFESPEENTFDLEVETEDLEAATPIAPLDLESMDTTEPLAIRRNPVVEEALGLNEETLAALQPEATQANRTRAGIPALDADRLEEIIRAQSRDIIEAVVRKIVPDLAENIIRAELERLLGENEVERPRSP